MWFLLLICPFALALSLKDVPNPQDHGGWVSDAADILPSAAEKRIDRLLYRLNQRTSAQFAVVAVPAIDAQGSPRKFATDLFNLWGVGDAKKQNGILMLVVQRDRRIEIVTGKGMTAALQDSAVESIIRRNMLPHFDRADPGAGTLEGVKAIVANLRGIDRTESALPHKVVYRVLALAALTAALIGYGWLLWFWLHPMRVAPTGSVEARDKIGAVHESYFIKMGFRELVKASIGLPEWPAAPAWMTTAALAVLGAAAASLALALPPPDLEIAFLRWGVIGGVCSALVVIVLLPIARANEFPSGKGAGRIARWWRHNLSVGVGVALAAGVLLSMICTWALLSDRMTIAVLVPAYALMVNLVSARFVTRELIEQPWYPSKFTCQRCNGQIQELDQELVKQILTTVELRAVDEKNVAWRGWRCTSCHPELRREGVYLYRGVRSGDIVCDRCKQPAYAVRFKKGWRYLDCFNCNHQKKQKLPAVAGAGAGVAAAYAVSSYSPAQDDDSSDDSHDIGTGSSDTGSGGGSSDGAGAGGSW